MEPDSHVVPNSPTTATPAGDSPVEPDSPVVDDSKPNSKCVTPSFLNFLKVVCTKRPLGILGSGSNFMDGIANLYITSKSKKEEINCKAEEALWEECRWGGWKKTLFQAVVALRLNPAEVDRKRACLKPLFPLLDDTYLGPEYYKFTVILIVDLSCGIPGVDVKAQLVETTSSAVSLYPHEPVYFGMWMHAVALLGNMSNLLNTTSTRCRTVGAVLEAAELSHYKHHPYVALGLARLLYEAGEHRSVVTVVESYIDRDYKKWMGLDGDFRSYLKWVQAKALLELVKTEPPLHADKHVTNIAKLLCDEVSFPSQCTTMKYAVSIMVGLKGVTSDMDSVLADESDRLCRTPPPLEASVDDIVSYVFLLMLSGRSREGLTYLQTCKRRSSEITSTDFPLNVLPSPSFAEPQKAMSGVGCQLYILECFSAYMKAFHLHGELIRSRRMLKPCRQSVVPGDEALLGEPFETVLNGVHEYLSEHVFWSDKQHPPPVNAKTVAATLPSGLKHVHDKHLYAVVPFVLGEGILGGGHVRGILANPPREGRVFKGEVDFDDAAMEYGDIRNESDSDNGRLNLNIEYTLADEAQLSEKAAAHFGDLDASCRGVIHLRTAVTTLHRYLRCNCKPTTPADILTRILPVLHPTAPAFIDCDTWVCAFLSIHRWEVNLQ